MSQQMSSKLLADFAIAIDKGRITPQTLSAFIYDPQAVLRGHTRGRDYETEKLIGLIPKTSVVASHDFSLVNGEPLYSVIYQETEASPLHIVIHGHVEGPPYFGVGTPRVIGGQLCYRVEQSDGKQLVVWGGREGLLHDEIWDDIADVEGKPLYRARDRDIYQIVWGTEVIAQHDQTIMPQPKKFGDTWLYVLWVNREHMVLISRRDGQVQVRAQQHSMCFEQMGGNYLLYVASDGKKGTDRVVWGGAEGPKFERISTVTVVNRCPLYAGQRGDEWIIMWDDEVTPRMHGIEITRLTHAEGKFLYQATEHCLKTFIVYGDTEYPVYSKIQVPWVDAEGRVRPEAPVVVNGKPFYAAERDGQWRVVHGDDEGKLYDEIFSLTVDGTHIVYGARRGRKLFRVTRRI